MSLFINQFNKNKYLRNNNKKNLLFFKPTNISKHVTRIKIVRDNECCVKKVETYSILNNEKHLKVNPC